MVLGSGVHRNRESAGREKMSSDMVAGVITRMAYKVGENSATADEAASQGLTVSSATVLKEAGFGIHHRAAIESDAYQFAHSVAKQIQDQGSDLSDVDAIVYATCIPTNANRGSQARYSETRDVKYLMDYTGSHLQSDFGMKKAIVLGVGQQACTGLLGGLRLGQMFLNAEPAFKKVLCLTSDRFPEGALYEQAYNLISDGAAGALVEREGQGYRIRACHQLTNGAMAQASDDETVGHFFNYTHRLVQETLKKAGVTAKQIRWIVPQNTNSKAWQILSRLLGIPFESVALITLGSVGHMISGDNIVNLIELERSGQVQKGDLCLMMMAGYGLNWQAVILEKT